MRNYSKTMRERACFRSSTAHGNERILLVVTAQLTIEIECEAAARAGSVFDILIVEHDLRRTVATMLARWFQ
jgi:hypothetical protein